MNVIGYTESGSIRVILDGQDSESTVPNDMGNRHRIMIAEWESEGNTIPPYVPPTPVAFVSQPAIFAAGAVCIQDGSVAMLELAAQINGAYYEEGWLMAFFTEEQDENGYLIFAQTDVPARIEQFKGGGSFELVFTDPSTGAPVGPGRIDLQILKVR